MTRFSAEEKKTKTRFLAERSSAENRVESFFTSAENRVIHILLIPGIHSKNTLAYMLKYR